MNWLCESLGLADNFSLPVFYSPGMTCANWYCFPSLSNCFCWRSLKGQHQSKIPNKLQKKKKEAKKQAFHGGARSLLCFISQKKEDMSFAPPSSVSAISYWFCRASAGEPPVMRKPTHDLLCGEEDFLTLTHTMLPLPTLSFCVSFFNSLVLVCWWARTCLVEVHGNGERLHYMPLPQLAYLGWTTASGDIYNQCVFIDRNRQSLPPLPNCCTTACICSFTSQFGTETKWEFH